MLVVDDLLEWWAFLGQIMVCLDVFCFCFNYIKTVQTSGQLSWVYSRVSGSLIKAFSHF